MQTIKLWIILNTDELKCIGQGTLNYEARLEKWIKNDISIISDNLILSEHRFKLVTIKK